MKPVKSRRTRKLRTSRRTRKRQHGGKFMGKGSFGAVYAEPRFPCEGESYEDVLGKKGSL